MDENPYESGQAKCRPKDDPAPLFTAPILTLFMLLIVLPLLAMVVVLIEWWFGS